MRIFTQKEQLYAHISNLFELALFRSLGVEIIYPAPPPILIPEIATSSADTISSPSLPPPPQEGEKIRKSRFSAVWSFLTKKTFNIRQSFEQYEHTTNVLANGPRHMKHEALPPPPMTKAETEDAISRLAIGVSDGVSDPFTAALRAIEAESSIFSTSHSVRFDPPNTLIRLTRDEVEEPPMTSSQNTSSTGEGSHSSGNRTFRTTTTTTTARKRRRVTGADKAALSSILGWRPDGSGSGFGGTSTFLKHQCITVLYSSTVHTENSHEMKLPSGRATSPHPINDTPSVAGTAGGKNGHGSKPSPGHWTTYRYYDEREPSLGQWIVETSEEAEIVRHQQNVTDDVRPLEHTWLHLNRKLTAQIEIQYPMNDESVQLEESIEQDFEDITVRNSCSVCGKVTPSVVLEPRAWCASLYSEC